MYGTYAPKELKKIADVGHYCFELMIDAAHNSTPKDEEFFIELNQEQWDIISKWEAHLRQCFECLLEDIGFDLKKARAESRRAKKKVYTFTPIEGGKRSCPR